MPVVEIDVIGEISMVDQPGLANTLADSLAPIFGKDPGRTWVRLNFVEPGAYAEGGGGPRPGVLPVFVQLLLARLPDLDDRQKLAEEISKKVGSIIGRPAQNVHVIFEPEATGRVAFGGKLVL